MPFSAKHNRDYLINSLGDKRKDTSPNVIISKCKWGDNIKKSEKVMQAAIIAMRHDQRM